LLAALNALEMCREVDRYETRIQEALGPKVTLR
jgi:hypothetical protein